MVLREGEVVFVRNDLEYQEKQKIFLREYYEKEANGLEENRLLVEKKASS